MSGEVSTRLCVGWDRRARVPSIRIAGSARRRRSRHLPCRSGRPASDRRRHANAIGRAVRPAVRHAAERVVRAVRCWRSKDCPWFANPALLRLDADLILRARHRSVAGNAPRTASSGAAEACRRLHQIDACAPCTGGIGPTGSVVAAGLRLRGARYDDHAPQERDRSCERRCAVSESTSSGRTGEDGPSHPM